MSDTALTDVCFAHTNVAREQQSEHHLNAWPSCTVHSIAFSPYKNTVTLPPLSSILSAKGSAVLDRSGCYHPTDVDNSLNYSFNDNNNQIAVTGAPSNNSSLIFGTSSLDCAYASQSRDSERRAPLFRVPGGTLGQEHVTTIRRGKTAKKRANAEGRKAPNVNVAFQQLRTLIPTEPVDRRLSKVETLRLAVSYIQHLGQTLNADIRDEQPCMSSIAEVEGVSGSICTFCMSKKRKMAIT